MAFPQESKMEGSVEEYDLGGNNAELRRNFGIISIIGFLVIILACINFGSEVTLNAIVLSIGCARLKRLRGEKLLPRGWSLGKWGGVVNDISLAFLAVALVFSFFPMTPNPTAVDMNWASLMFGAVGILATANYFLSARYHYVAPVTLVKGDRRNNIRIFGTEKTCASSHDRWHR